MHSLGGDLEISELYVFPTYLVSDDNGLPSSSCALKLAESCEKELFMNYPWRQMQRNLLDETDHSSSE